jgi:DNA-binding LacI/PurR family transcriptional regulator
MGADAVSLLLAMVEKQGKPVPDKVYKPQLVIRESTGPVGRGFTI